MYFKRKNDKDIRGIMRKRMKKTALSLTIVIAVLIILSLPSYVLSPQNDNKDKDNYTVVIPYRIDGRKENGSDIKLRGTYLFKLINHRGYAVEAPENTLPAFTLSKEKGYSYVETDVQFTKDGVAVCLHDKLINRTARCEDGSMLTDNIQISDITYAQALTYDFGVWKSEKYKNTKIPTFEQFIKLCRDLGLFPYIELKVNDLYTDEQLKSIADIISKYQMSNKVTFICFNYIYLEKMHSLCASSRIGFLYNKKTPLMIERILKMKTPENEVFVDARYNCADEIVDTCKNNNLPLEVWLVDDEKTLDSADSYISGATTNRLRYSLG